jgi:hypothetical protein
MLVELVLVSFTSQRKTQTRGAIGIVYNQASQKSTFYSVKQSIISVFSTDYYRVANEEEEIQTNENLLDVLGEEAEDLPDIIQDLEAQLAHVRQRLGDIP